MLNFLFMFQSSQDKNPELEQKIAVDGKTRCLTQAIQINTASLQEKFYWSQASRKEFHLSEYDEVRSCPQGVLTLISHLPCPSSLVRLQNSKTVEYSAYQLVSWATVRVQNRITRNLKLTPCGNEHRRFAGNSVKDNRWRSSFFHEDAWVFPIWTFPKFQCERKHFLQNRQ